MSWWRLAGATAAAAAIAGAGAALTDATEEQSSVAPLRLSDFQEVPCDGSLVASLRDQGKAVTCGFLEVPESDISALKVKLAIIRIRPQRTTQAPLLLLAGGPGDSFVVGAERRLDYLLPLGKERELLLVDQRGTGKSLPFLACRSKMREREDLERCYEGWSIDLDPQAYSTAQNVTDIEAVLNTFEIPFISLMGVSYGTRLALQFTDAYPQRVQSLILDSPMPVTEDLLAQVGSNAQSALDDVFVACSLQKKCGARFSAGMPELLQLVTRLNENPDHEGHSGRSFIQDLTQMMYSPGVLPLVPLIVDEALEGRFGLFDELLDGFSGHTFAFGAHLSVQCSEQFSKTSRQKIEEGDLNVAPELREALSAISYAEYCDVWKVEPTENKRETESSVPTLILSGLFDPITPPAYARLIAETLSKSRVETFVDLAHGVAFSKCGTSTVNHFLSREDLSQAPTRSSCNTETSALNFRMAVPRDTEIKAVVAELRNRL